MKQKYILTDETSVFNGFILHRIKAVRDFGSVREGDLGGFVWSEHNLSHKGNAWVFGNAKVFENAQVCDNAIVYDNAIVFDEAKVCDDALIYGNAEIYHNAKIYDRAIVYGKAEVYCNAKVYGTALICGDARVCDNAKVFGNAMIDGKAEIYGDAKVSSIADYIVFKNWWSSGRYFTWTRSNDKWSAGCFYGTGKELIAKAYKDSEESGREYQRIVEYVESIKKK